MKLTKAQIDELIGTLSERFATNPARHKGLKWAVAEERLRAKPAKLASLFQMEATGGEPDLVGIDKRTSGAFAMTKRRLNRA